MQKITTFLWFDKEAEQAADYYVSLFPDSRVTAVTRYNDAGPGPAGSVMTVSFQLAGQEFIACNAGPGHPFTDAISLMIDCETQAEVDTLWEQLTADGGEPGPCGWCKDRYGLSWQVVPDGFLQLIADPDPGRARRAMQAMLQMQKLDLEALRRAVDAQPAAR
jgi:predicted 3-demethylubiquinone-9 3-methyltransferase (glyoxalase superfamily)